MVSKGGGFKILLIYLKYLIEFYLYHHILKSQIFSVN